MNHYKYGDLSEIHEGTTRDCAECEALRLVDRPVIETENKGDGLEKSRFEMRSLIHEDPWFVIQVASSFGLNPRKGEEPK